MQNVGRKQNATVAMAFLFVSMVITPLSLKAIGISPNFSAGVEAWRRVADIFGNSHQPVSASEMLALNTALDETHPGAIFSSTDSLLASIQSLDAQPNVEPATSIDDGIVGSPAPVARATSPCAKAMKPARRNTSPATMPTNVAVCVEKARTDSARVAEVIRVVVPTYEAGLSDEARLNSERAMTKYRVSLRDVMKFVPKDVQVMLKSKAPVLPSLPTMTSCDLHKSAAPKAIQSLPAVQVSIPSATSSEAPENSEL